MPKVLIFYYSRTGNTEKMASAIAEGLRTVEGVEVDVKFYLDASELANYDAIVIGAPTYHHDMPLEIKRLFENAAVKNVNLKGKIGAAFGSYGWSGEAPRLALEIMENKFGMQVIKPPLLIRYSPDQTGLEKCRELGRNVADKVKPPSMRVQAK